jgi:hypothetical protein
MSALALGSCLPQDGATGKDLSNKEILVKVMRGLSEARRRYRHQPLLGRARSGTRPSSRTGGMDRARRYRPSVASAGSRGASSETAVR